MASIFEEAGVTVSQIVSKADSMTNKLKSTKKPNKERTRSASPVTEPEASEPASNTDA